MGEAIKAGLWTLVGFACGSLPFSVWLGRLFAHTDIQHYGDRNPGASNVGRAAGWRVGLSAMLLDALKGFLPVGFAHFRFGISGWALLPVALAPILGHAYSPLIRFRGGKAVAVTFGIWTGLRLGEGPIMLGLFLALFSIVQNADAWSVILTMLCFLGHLILRSADTVTLAIWGGNMALLLWKHRHSLRESICPRQWLLKLVASRKSFDHHEPV